MQIGCLGFHPWPYRAATPEVTDELRIDLDPGPGVTFDMVREAAVETKALFDELGIAAFVKTTGNRGLHIYVRLLPTLGLLRRAGARRCRSPASSSDGVLDLITGQWWKEERGARVFIDFNQNAPHKTVFGAWCVRPRVGGQVSTPIRWDEVATVVPDELTLSVVPDRVAADGDPWEAMNDAPQSIEELVAWRHRDLDAGILDAPWPPVYPKQPHEPPRRESQPRQGHDPRRGATRGLILPVHPARRTVSAGSGCGRRRRRSRGRSTRPSRTPHGPWARRRPVRGGRRARRPCAGGAPAGA